MGKCTPFFITILLLLFSFSLSVKNAEAKVLPQAQKSTSKSTVVKNVKVTGISVLPRLRSDRRALEVNFTNLQNASAVSYMLSYQTSTQDEGAMGALNLTGISNQSTELLFGTCSKNVCRYHTGIKNARLDISYTLKTGKKYLKKYKIKV